MRPRFRRAAGPGAHAARAHSGDPQAGGPAQIVGGSGDRAANVLLRVAAQSLRGEPAAAARAVMTAGEVVTRGGGICGPALTGPVAAVAGQGFDGPVEPVPGRAPDHGGLAGPAGG